MIQHAIRESNVNITLLVRSLSIHVAIVEYSTSFLNPLCYEGLLFSHVEIRNCNVNTRDGDVTRRVNPSV